MAYGADVSELDFLTALEDGDSLAGQCMIPPPPVFGGASSAAFAGDFYRESNDVTRGVTLGDFGVDSFQAHESDWFSPAKDFFEPAEPREVPWAGVTSTSLLVPRSSAAAAEVATAVEGFLREQASFSVLKVNPQKLSTRAVARFQQLGACDLKARLFQQSDDSFVLELAKRSGCALAFAEVFRQVAGFLVARFKGVRAANGGTLPVNDGWTPLAAPLVAGPLAEEDYSPLMEAAAVSADTESQVEAIAALAAAGAGCAAAAACLQSVLAGGALDALLHDSRLHVAASAELLAAELTALSLCRA